MLAGLVTTSLFAAPPNVLFISVDDMNDWVGALGYESARTPNIDRLAVRSERYRYIRYANGGEELYDHSHDPNEWTNLAGDPKYATVIADHAKWLPKRDVPGALRKGAFDFDEKAYTWKRKP